MSDRVVTRQILNDWICNDGLEHLFEEGYLTPDNIDLSDVELAQAVIHAHTLHKSYERVARRIQNLVDEEREA